MTVVAVANVILRVEATRIAGGIGSGLLCLQILMLFLEMRLWTSSIKIESLIEDLFLVYVSIISATQPQT